MSPPYVHEIRIGFERDDGEILPVTDEFDVFQGRITPNVTVDLDDSEDQADEALEDDHRGHQQS